MAWKVKKGDLRINLPNDYKVMFRGITYYPQSYEMSFDVDGNPINLAVLHDLKANSIVRCLLEQVNPLVQEDV